MSVDTTLFIGDLHLDEQRPEIVRLFEAFLSHWTGRAQRLFILGDLFEFWIGDDYQTPLSESVAAALRACQAGGTEVAFIAGNRDFLVGEAYAERAHFNLLSEPLRLELNGETTLVMHGDALCTDDQPYQQFRALVRDPQWQREFLQKTIAQRLAYARQARAESQRHTAAKSEEIMDVNQQTVLDTMREHGVQKLIHGHTHRPDIHHFRVNHNTAQRLVVGDWYDQGSVLIHAEGQFSLRSLSSSDLGSLASS